MCDKLEKNNSRKTVAKKLQARVHDNEPEVTKMQKDNTQKSDDKKDEVRKLRTRKTEPIQIKKEKLEVIKLETVSEKQNEVQLQKKDKVKIKDDKSIKKSKSKIKWSKKSKRTLLEALKKHGPNNIDAISEMLPELSPEAIKARIFIYEVLAEYFYEDDLINNWMKCGICKPGDSCIPEALLFIRLLENHPPPSESKFDYREIYNFLHNVFSSEKQSFPDLTERDRNMLLSLISKIDKRIYPKCQNQLWQYLGKVYPRRHIRHVYPGKKNHFNTH